MKKMTTRLLPSSLSLALLSLPAFAQTAPDAGQILQEVKRPAAQPDASKVPEIRMPASAAVTLPGGAQVTLNTVAITGNTLFDQPTLTAAIGDVSGKHFDLAGLRELADRITTHYRSKGYPFTRSVIPPQDMKDGVLRIQVLEGRYGKVEATSSDAWLASGSQKFLGPLQNGEMIESTALERVMLILGNQPGVKIMPVISPGQQTGSGDLNVKVERESNYSGQIGIDNAGSRYTGEHRLQATVNANSRMLLGDRLTLRGMVSDHSMWLGSVDYEAPIGGSGLRGQIGYGDNYYQLGSQFAALDATGFAKTATARLSYPLLRSQASNVTLSGAYQNKRLEDRYGATGTVNEKSSNSWPVAVQFDHRDRFGGGGITYGMATWTSGNLNLNGAFATTDATTAQTAGHFNKYNLDIARIQKLPGDFALYGRYSAQWTSQNLDSSERFGLGGIYGVRAYPLGEGMGDRGWLGQVELRYLAGPYTPFVFYDAGRGDTNARPWDSASSTSRSIAGGGAGVRVDYKQWSIDSTLAWRTRGGPASADTSDRSPRLWFMATYSF